MKLPDAWSRATVEFDDPNLVSFAGLAPVLALGERAGLSRLIGEKVRINPARTTVRSAGVNPAGKLTSIIAGMACGADCIDDLDVIRCGGMTRLFGGVYAATTAGQLLREFTHGHTMLLASVLRAHLVNLVPVTGLLPGIEQRAFIDIDSLLRPVFGHAKQGASFGHTKIAGKQVLRKGLSPLVTGTDRGRRGDQPRVPGRRVGLGGRAGLPAVCGTADSSQLRRRRHRPRGATTPHVVAPLRRETSADPASVADLRDGIRDWLAQFTPSPQDELAMDLAVSELVANAVEHAYSPGSPGTVRLDANLGADGVLQLVVADDGTWNAPGPTPADFSGRGLWMVGAVVDDLRVTHPASPDGARPELDAPGGTTVVVRHRLHRPAAMGSQPARVLERTAVHGRAGSVAARHRPYYGLRARQSAKRLTEVHIGRAARFTSAELERFVSELDAESERPAARKPSRPAGRQRSSTDQDGLFTLPAIINERAS